MMEFSEMFGGGLANTPMLPICLAVHRDCCFTWGDSDFGGGGIWQNITSHGLGKYRNPMRVLNAT
jgi:hypothetical protein